MISRERLLSVKPDTQSNRRTERTPSLRGFLARLAFVAPVLAVTVLPSLACSDSEADLGPKNVPLVSVVLRDEDDDRIFTMRDYWIQKGEDSLAGYDLNGDFSVDEEDVKLESSKVGTDNADAKFDFDGKGRITIEDVKRLRDHFGKVKNDKNPKVRLDELWAGIRLDMMLVKFEPGTTDEDIKNILTNHGLVAPEDEQGKLIKDKLRPNKGTYIFAIIPEQVEQANDLESLLEKVAREKKVVITGKVPASVTLEGVGQNVDK